MTQGSEVHEQLGRHLRSCEQCRSVDPEAVRIRQPNVPRHSVPRETLDALCPVGRMAYRDYLNWLAAP